MEFPIGIIDNDDQQVDSISTGHKRNETVVLNDFGEKFVKNNLPTGWIKINYASGTPLN